MDTAMPSNFEQLKAKISEINTLAQGSGVKGFFAQEVLRFFSIACTLLEVKDFSLDEKATIDERHITHILSRSLLENFFRIIYLFDDPKETVSRYEKLKNSFKEEYRKLYNEEELSHKNELEKADDSWTNLSKLPNVIDMLNQVKRKDGGNLRYLYFIYRISSFDIHGNNLKAIFVDVFEKKCNFPVLKIKYAFEIVTNEYLCILNKILSVKN